MIATRQLNEVLYIGVFRITPNESQDKVGQVHAAWLDFLKERGIGTVPGEVMAKEFVADNTDLEQVREAIENKGRYVMATDHEALCKLGFSWEAANRLIPVVTEPA